MHAAISLFNDNWCLCRLYFFSEERIYARLMLLLLIAIELLTIGLSVVLTYWNKNFINTLQNFDQPAFIRSLMHFVALAFIIIVVSVHKTYLTQSFQLRWRRWMTKDFLDKYLSNHAYYQMSLLNKKTETATDSNDNPDQRISMDIDAYIETVFRLTMDFLNALVSLFSYVVMLWTLSGVVTITITTSWSFHIYGMMVWAALLYAGLGTVVTNLIGRALFRLKYEQEHFEANFRYGLVRLRDHAESVAFYRSEAAERASLLSVYHTLITNLRRIIHRRFALSWFDEFYQTAAIIFPYLVAFKRYFSRQLTLGDLLQISVAFENVHRSLSFIPNSYEIIVRWRSATKRLIEFAYVLDDLHVSKHNCKVKFVHVPDAQALCIQNLTIHLPLKKMESSGQILIRTFSLILESYRSVLITGKSGSGKSTFLRTIAGIWPYGDGTITFPLGETMAFLPQKTYCPLGSLRRCLTYPSACSSAQDEKKLARLISLCQMNEWLESLNEVQDWSRVLSLGEQQKMAFIRVLYLRPKWVFLDEITASLDEEAEAYLYSTLVNELANHSTIVSVGHRHSLRQFHQVELMLQNEHVLVIPLSADGKPNIAIF